MTSGANNSNAGKVFDRVISIDAWRSPFSEEKSSASVHVDLSFLEANMGEESDSPVRFRVALRRAKLSFVIPANEPLAVIQSSVARETPMKGSVSREFTAKADKAGSGKLQLGFSGAKILDAS